MARKKITIGGLEIEMITTKDPRVKQAGGILLPPGKHVFSDKTVLITKDGLALELLRGGK